MAVGVGHQAGFAEESEVDKTDALLLHVLLDAEAAPVVGLGIVDEH